jgi:hypothetical protein
MFNKYTYLDDLSDSIRDEKPKDLWEFIYDSIASECTYAGDCLNIIGALSYFHWEDETGVTDIYKAAQKALEELIVDNWYMFKEFDN